MDNNDANDDNSCSCGCNNAWTATSCHRQREQGQQQRLPLLLPTRTMMVTTATAPPPFAITTTIFHHPWTRAHTLVFEGGCSWYLPPPTTTTFQCKHTCMLVFEGA